MPTERASLHRIAPGWITKTALLAGAYLLSALTVVSDQKVDNQVLIPWIAPMRPNETPTYSDRDRSLSGQVHQHGFQIWNWKFAYWTFGMVGTWQTTFYTNVLLSTPVTVGTYDGTDTFVAVQAYMSPLILPGPSGEAALGGYQNVLIEFLGGIAAPA